MKLNLFFFLAFYCCCGMLTAQDNIDEKTNTNDMKKFSYSYGVLIGQGMQKQGVQPEDIDMAELMRAIETMLNREKPELSENEATNVLRERIGAMQAKASEAALAEQKAFFDENGKKDGMISLPSGLQYEVMKEGSGPVPTAQNKVTTHYHGTLLNGNVFDSSVQRGQPASFPVTGVIPGWQEILQLMPVGSKWRVFIPSELAYGQRGQGGIPGNAALIFEIELLSIDN